MSRESYASNLWHAGRDGVTISVGDIGTGISPQHLDRIFNPLFTTKSDGMGMGLSICRAIIEAHDGHLSVSPNIPRGAVFQFTLHGSNSASAARVISASLTLIHSSSANTCACVFPYG